LRYPPDPKNHFLGNSDEYYDLPRSELIIVKISVNLWHNVHVRGWHVILAGVVESLDHGGAIFHIDKSID
jgi:hypothetical protein